LRDPRDRERSYFTDQGAWEYIAEALEDGKKVEVVELQKPQGAKGYVLLLQGVAPAKTIYVKLQLGSDKVIGRSFHESCHSSKTPNE